MAQCRDLREVDQAEIVTYKSTKLQSALSCKMKRQTDCLTERKFSLFLQQKHNKLLFSVSFLPPPPPQLW